LLLLIDNQDVTDPRVNLALEEYALRNLDIKNDYLLLYINEPSVIIGRHQNTFEEINADFIDKNSIKVVRRLSGGGAVYHDHGNLNFSFITRYQRSNFNNYRRFTEPIIRALRLLGVDATLNGRNDIVVGMRKISGNAQYITKDRMLSHGTLLFNSNLDNILNALYVRKVKIESRGIKSAHSASANILEFLKEKIDLEEFRQTLLKCIFGKLYNLSGHTFKKTDWKKINDLAKSKYSTWNWNFSESPEFTVKISRRFYSGRIDVSLFVKKGIIENIKFHSNIFLQSNTCKLEKALTSIRYRKEDINSALRNIDINQFFGNITKIEFVACIVL